MIHTGQAIVDVVMEVDAVPQPGQDVFASHTGLHTGGGFNVMAAARREGAPVLYTGGHGSGPLGDLVRGELTGEGVDILLEPHPDLDSGFCVALVDDDAERTFVSTVGAEGHVPLSALDDIELRDGDVVYVSGYSLVHPDNAAMLVRCLPRMRGRAEIVVDAAPVIADVPPDVLTAIMHSATIWTVNEREAKLLHHRRRGETYLQDPALLATELAADLDATVLVRVGAGGCWLAKPGSTAMLLPGIKVTAVDTNGAGDAHTGVLCAGLAMGRSLEESLERANVAAGIAVTRRGPATSPTAQEIDERIAAAGD